MPEKPSNVTGPLEHDDELDTDEEDAEDAVDDFNREHGDEPDGSTGAPAVGAAASDATVAAPSGSGEAAQLEQAWNEDYNTRKVRVVDHGRSERPPAVRVVDGGEHAPTVVIGASSSKYPPPNFDGQSDAARSGDTAVSGKKKKRTRSEYTNDGHGGADNSGR